MKPETFRQLKGLASEAARLGTDNAWVRRVVHVLLEAVLETGRSQYESPPPRADLTVYAQAAQDARIRERELVVRYLYAHSYGLAAAAIEKREHLVLEETAT